MRSWNRETKGVRRIKGCQPAEILKVELSNSLIVIVKIFELKAERLDQAAL